MLFSSRKTQMIEPDRALPGRDEPMPVPARHEVLGTPLMPPFPEGLQRAVFGMGCFWGAERVFWQADGRVHDGGRLRGRLHAEPVVRGGLLDRDRPRRGRARRSSTRT